MSPMANDGGRNGRIKAICFDVDGTLIHHAEEKTVWQVLNQTFLGDDVRNEERMAAFRAGRLSYADWVALDVGDWIERGVGRAQIEAAIRAELTAVEGAREAIDELRARGYKLAVISGTLDVTLRLLLADVVFDRVFSNKIFFDERGAISGWRATPYDVDGKARALADAAREWGIAPAECAFVGDHWNDLAALRAAGFGVAFRPKDDALRAVADVVIEDGPLTGLLEFFPEAEG